MIKKLFLVILGVVFIFTGIACSSDSQTNTSQSGQENSQAQQSTPEAPQTLASPPTAPDKGKKNPVVTIEMNDGNKIKLELYPKVAPNTVNNFISLVKKGFYNNTIFHRVIPDVNPGPPMIQGGDPQGTGMGDPGYFIKGEFTINGFTNNLNHTRGVISMARAAQPYDSAGSQFFIMVNDCSYLDGQYATFGKVIEGMEVVDKIAKTERGAQDRPLQEQKMKKVTVDTFGIEYPEPEKISQ